MEILQNISRLLLSSRLVNLVYLLVAIKCTKISRVGEVSLAVLRRSLCWCPKVFVEDHIIVILRNKTFESKMFRHEANKKRTGSIIRKSCR